MRIAILLLVMLAAASAVLARPHRNHNVHVLQEEIERALRIDWPRANTSAIEALARLYVEHADEIMDASEEEAKPVGFDMSACEALPPRDPPTNISDLSPVDIRYIAAFGDSITCGSNALSTTWLNLKMYRGLSFSIGGDSGVSTLPNILSTYASPYGASYGTGDGNRGLNIAEGGAIVQDMVGQARSVVDKLKAAAGGEYDSAWKVITLWIGGNNLCEVCKTTSGNDETAYETNLRQALNIISEIPRAFVNIIPGLDYTQIAKYKGPFCSLALGFVCDCCTSTDSSKQAVVREMNNKYTEIIQRLAPTYRRDDFAVVVQPFLLDTAVPDKNLISTADCFHPSGSGQALFAVGLWNSMITPVDQKFRSISPGITPLCATNSTRFFV